MVAALLHELSRTRLQPGHDQAFVFNYALINSLECVSGRHLLETTVRGVAKALGIDSFNAKCENLAQLIFELSKMLKYPPQPEQRHFVLVFDGIDRQKEAPPTLLPALARLSEIVGCPIPSHAGYCSLVLTTHKTADSVHVHCFHRHESPAKLSP